jgi:hypothetical protein
MNRSTNHGFRIQNPKILDSGWTLVFNKINWLRAIPESSWILDLDSGFWPKSLCFCGFQRPFQNPAVLLPLQGRGVVANAYAWRPLFAIAVDTVRPSHHPHQQPLKKEAVMPDPMVVHEISFTSFPKVGTILMREGQRYELIALEPHRRTDGKMTTLLVWETYCAETGHPFQTKTCMKTKAINRRCRQHSKPGIAVSKTGRDRQRKFLSKPRRTKRKAYLPAF